tara:strand:- start:127 stop:1083 length:957 start_codon:yes stop_codon:yes gene_type:complete
MNMTENIPNQKLVSIIIPTFNSEKFIEKLIIAFYEIFKLQNPEIIIVNDCSVDNTHQKCLELSNKFSKIVTYLKFSKNMGEHNATMAGIKFATSKYVLICDDDFQHPPDQAMKLFEYMLKNKFDVVYGDYKKKKHNFFRNFISKVNDWSANIILSKPKGLYLSSFKCIRKNIADRIAEYNGPYPYLDGLILSITSNISSIEITHLERHVGKSGYSFKKLVKLYSNMAMNFSTVPIHISSILGLIISIISGIYGIITIIQKILNPNMVMGYTSIFIAIIFFSGVQLMFLGLIGEYIGKILKNVNKQPQYFIDYIKKRNE